MNHTNLSAKSQANPKGSRQSIQPNLASPATDTEQVIRYVALRTRCLQELTEFYNQTLGLDAYSDTKRSNVVHLRNASGNTLITLVGDPQAVPSSPRDPGLFHIAFLFKDLKEWKERVSHCMQSGARLRGISDHKVSWAAYFADPEGNGLELYWDLPKDSWPRDGDEVRMVTEPLDFEPTPSPIETRVNSATIGHLHLQASSIDQARDYLDHFDLRITQSNYPGALFMARGDYHHHLAVNTWNTRPTSLRNENATGLIEVGISAPPSQTEDWTDASGVRFVPLH